mgnify:CR=1 FL=1
MEYNIKYRLDRIHNTFNNECHNVDLNNFKTNKLMTNIVQNCPNWNGQLHKDYILTNYKDIYDKIDFDILKGYDNIGGLGNQGLIDGLTPKVFSYLKEAIIFYDYYLKKKEIKKISKLLIIGGGYGMEAVVIYYICSLMSIEVEKITGIDMKNVAELQNKFFKKCNLDNICKSYDEDYCDIKIDIVYSNCCLAELSTQTNYNYWYKYIMNSNGFYIVWGLWCADIPQYYKKYENTNIDSIINESLVSERTNCLFLK